MARLTGSAEITALISSLASTPARLAETTASASDEQLDRAAPGEWSTRTVLAHLRDDEFMVMRLRLERMLVEEAPSLAPFDEKGWSDSRFRGRDGLDELLADFRVQRAASLGILQMMTDEQWRRTGFQPEYGEFDIHWWVQHCLEHDNDHVAQIRNTLAIA